MKFGRTHSVGGKSFFPEFAVEAGTLVVPVVAGGRWVSERVCQYGFKRYAGLPRHWKAVATVG